jgi:hypothetical protein
MNAFVFAAGLDWLEALLPFLFVLFWIVSQVVNVFRNVAGRGKPQRPAPPRPAVERVDDVRADLERQIGEFLNERAQRQGEPSPGPTPVPRPQASPRPQPGRGRPEKPKPLATRPAGGNAPAEASAAQATPSGRLGSLGNHGGDVAKHVQDAFAGDLEHQRSRLARPATGGGAAAARPAPATHELVTLLRDPDSLRRLFLVREVLDRPIERWE